MSLFDDDELLYGNTPDANDDDAKDDSPDKNKNEAKSEIIELDFIMFIYSVNIRFSFSRYVNRF